MEMFSSIHVPPTTEEKNIRDERSRDARGTKTITLHRYYLFPVNGQDHFNDIALANEVWKESDEGKFQQKFGVAFPASLIGKNAKKAVYVRDDDPTRDFRIFTKSELAVQAKNASKREVISKQESADSSVMRLVSRMPADKALKVIEKHADNTDRKRPRE